MKKGLLALFLALCALIFGGTFAPVTNASNLHVASSSMFSKTYNQACSTAAITTTVNLSGTITLSNIPVACQNLPIVGHTLSSLLTGSASFSGVATSSTISFPNTGLNVLSILGVKVLINGWEEPTTFALLTVF